MKDKQKIGADPDRFGLRPMKTEEALLFSRWELDERPYPWTKEQFEGAHLADHKTVLVMEEEGAPSGFAAIQVVGDEAYLENIMVHPSRRRQGRGRRLLEKVVKWAQACGAKVFVLDADAANNPARNLYQSSGFKQTSFRSMAYPRGEDAQVWFMDLRSGETI